MVTRTINQLHFEDLDAIRFEELVLSMVYRMRRWEKLDHFGKKGSDEGVDIRAIELLENGKENTYFFQCKRYLKITNSQLKNIVDDYISKNSSFPEYYILVISFAMTRKQIEYFEKYCIEKGFKAVWVWTSSIIETMLYSDYQDLLFAYFGINLTEKRNKLTGSIRRNIALKKRMKKDFLKSVGSINSEERMERIEKPYLKFIHSEVLIHSIYDKAYPAENTLLDNNYTGYYKAEVYDFYHNGLLVRAYPYAKNIKLKIKEDYDSEEYEIAEVRVQVLGCIPFENIIEYDIDGDEYYNYPHIFCDFINVTDPYEKIKYISNNGYTIDEEDIIE